MTKRTIHDPRLPGCSDGDFYLLEFSMLTIPEGRRANPHAVALLKESIARLGVINPVTVTHDHVLVAGMNRVVASRELGLSYVPVIVLPEGEPILEIELSENLARLHRTEEQLTEARQFEARVLVEKQATMSLRAAAAEAGVPWTTAKRRVKQSATGPRGHGLHRGPVAHRRR